MGVAKQQPRNHLLSGSFQQLDSKVQRPVANPTVNLNTARHWSRVKVAGVKGTMWNRLVKLEDGKTGVAM